MSYKAFERMKKEGISQEHNYQTHAGMWLVGLNYGLYVVLCKNDEQYHIEVIDRDPKIINSLQKRIKSLTINGSAPPRLSDTQNHFKCRWCDHKHVCAGEVEPVKNCRSCAFSRPVMNGEWLCDHLGIILNMKQQVAGCENWYEFGK